MGCMYQLAKKPTPGWLWCLDTMVRVKVASYPRIHATELSVKLMYSSLISVPEK